MATSHKWRATFFPSFKAGPWINPTQPLGNNLKKIFNDPEAGNTPDPNNDPMTNRVSICTIHIIVMRLQFLVFRNGCLKL